MLSSIPLLSQNGTVTGSVSDSETNEPLMLFDKETTYMSLDLINESEMETKDLFFNVVKQNDSSLVFRANTSKEDKYLEFSYSLSQGKYEVDFNIDYHKIE